ncbi:MAG: hypothetical protein H8E55_25795 [Pelagibacterales bacterium]|nr:hypothetical protein [Pelagibacterales bacterium]
MNNKYFKLIQSIVTFLAFFYLYNFFNENINSNEINIRFTSKSLLIIFLLFVSNHLHSLGWSKILSDSESLSKKDTYLYAMKSHIGKYSFLKFGNFFIKLSQDYEKISKRNFLVKAAIEQISSVAIALTFGLFILYNDNLLLTFGLVLLINAILFFIFTKLAVKRSQISEKSTYSNGYLLYYLGNTCIQFLTIAYFFKSVEISQFIYFSAVYLFSSAISIVVSIIPAGLGVKESIFLYFSAVNLGQTEILNTLIQLRFLFIFADIVSYFYSLFLLKKN